MSSRPSNREAAGLVAGFALWSLAFVVLYGAHGAICAYVEGAGFRAVLVAIWITLLVAHAGLIAWFVRRLKSAPTELRFVRVVSLVLSIAALGATAWTGLPAISLEMC